MEKLFQIVTNLWADKEFKNQTHRDHRELDKIEFKKVVQSLEKEKYLELSGGRYDQIVKFLPERLTQKNFGF